MRHESDIGGMADARAMATNLTTLYLTRPFANYPTN